MFWSGYEILYPDIDASSLKSQTFNWLNPNPMNVLKMSGPPYFETDLPHKVVTNLGDTAFLKCSVFNLRNKTVSKCG